MAALMLFAKEGRRIEARVLAECGLGNQLAFGFAWRLGKSPCGRWFCPACNHRLQRRKTTEWRRSIETVIATGGGCGSLTLTLPATMPPRDRLDRCRQGLEKIRGKVAWRATGRGLKEKVGVLAAFEVSAEGGRPNPHVHLAVFGPDFQAVQDCLGWLLAAWLEINPGAGPGGQEMGPVRRPNGPWQDWIKYILKGTAVDPAWPGATLAAVLDLFPPGARHFSAWGRHGRVLAKRPAKHQAERPPAGGLTGPCHADPSASPKSQMP